MFTCKYSNGTYEGLVIVGWDSEGWLEVDLTKTWQDDK